VEIAMSDRPPAYTEFHPRWHRRKMSTYWWVGRRSHLAFILRELSSLFVGWSVLFFLLLVAAAARPGGYAAFLDFAAHPVVVTVNALSLMFVVYHAVTWFNLAPKAMVVHVAGRRVPGSLIAASNYGAWVAVSAAIAFLLLG
jgi:fumarate reductase subunit C